MTWETDDDDRTYRVVVNHEEQYSIWPAHTELPLGWKAEGTEGIKADCLAHIEVVWTDMRPLSLRIQMDQAST
jgi:MbtH protein